jgi:hypothetical protein
VAADGEGAAVAADGEGSLLLLLPAPVSGVAVAMVEER